MTTEIRKTGIEVAGDMVSWGAHFCLFYETKEDLLDTSISFCKSGLEREEYCLWIVAEPLTLEEAAHALKKAVPELDRYLADSRVELVSARDWFLPDGTFDSKRVTQACFEKLGRVAARGYPGIRVTGDTTWLTKKDWNHYCEIEESINEVIGSQRLSVLCAFPLEKCGPLEILDTVRNHQFALAKRYGNWDVIESAELKQAKGELKRLNEELEERVVERTNQLRQASEALREAQAQLAHVNRVTAMGQLAASITHELMQPITAGITSVQTATRWLRTEPPNLEEVRQALGIAAKAGNRAVEIIDRIRALFKKAPPRKDAFDINEAIKEIVDLTRSEALKNNVAVQTQLARPLPQIQGDKVQMQQVIVNLILNALEAMSSVDQGSRELLISTRNDVGGVLVTVRDSGPGVDPESLDRVFDAFYTTKVGGTGMGLSICRSIVEAHGGRIRASRDADRGATFQFTVPLTARAA